MGVTFSNGEFDTVLQALKQEYRLFAPRRLSGRGRFSDTDLIGYGQIDGLDQMVWDQKSTFSPKEILFPITQTLFRFSGDAFTEPEQEEGKVLIFMRPCDLNGIRRLDDMFLRNGPAEDVYYRRLRERVVFAMVECTTGFPTCFCVSMGANECRDYDLAVRFGEGTVDVDVADAGLQTFFQGAGAASEFKPEFIQRNEQVVRVPDAEEMPQEIYTHGLWDEYKARCIACGRCNTSCITCSCFTTTDIAYDDNPQMGERRRVWAGCHIDGFTDMAGGHQFRTDNGARMRFKTMHKIYDHRKRFGQNMCVGCGRCDDNCPEYISFANCINKVTDVLE